MDYSESPLPRKSLQISFRNTKTTKPLKIEQKVTPKAENKTMIRLPRKKSKPVQSSQTIQGTLV